MKPILVDTGCIVALLNPDDKYHEICVETIQEIRLPLVTCEAVIAEACHLMRRAKGASEAILANVETNVFQVFSCLPDGCQEVRSLMKKYDDVPMDFADACLVFLASRFKRGAIVTLDSDFSVYRWGSKNEVFQNLIDLS